MKRQIFAGEGFPYLAPAVDIAEVAAERGFAQSTNFNTDYYNPAVDDFTYIPIDGWE